MKKIILGLIIVFLSFGFVTVVNAEKKEEVKKVSCDSKVNIYLFWRDGCPYCEAAKTYFGELEKTYGECFELVKYNIYESNYNSELMQTVGEYFGDDVSGVPYIVIGEDTYAGYSDRYNESIEKSIVDNANDENYEDVVEKIINGETDSKKSSSSDTIVTVIIILVAIGGIVALIKTSREK